MIKFNYGFTVVIPNDSRREKMRILIATYGSMGDYAPSIKVGGILTARGNEVIVLGNDHFRGSIEHAGLRFVSYGTEEDYQGSLDNPDLWNPKKALGTLFGEAVKIVEKTYRLIEKYTIPGQTVLLASPLVPAARIAHETLHVPFATLAMQPIWLWSNYAPPKYSFPIPDWIGHFGKKVIRHLLSTLVLDPALKPVNAFRAQLGLTQPVKRFFKSWIFSPQLILCLWPEWFAPVQPDWPSQIVLSSFMPYDGVPPPGVSMPENWQETVRDSIIFTPGTPFKNVPEFFKTAVAVSKLLTKKVVLITPYKEQIPQPLPPHVHHFDFLPFSEAISLAYEIVHHGGINTVAWSFIYGKWQVISPVAMDQHDNGARVVSLGCGAVVPRKEFTAENVVRALDTRARPLYATNLQNRRRYAEEVVASSIERLFPTKSK